MASGNDELSFEMVQESANFILENTEHRPKIAIICGSGLGGLGDKIGNKTELSYGKIPNFPKSTVSGHAGKLIIGILNQVPLMCMQGRFHAYEGHALWQCAFPIRVMKHFGIETLIVTNAAGGINEQMQVGDIMLIKDHLNLLGLAGVSPFWGKHDPRFGPRFFATNKAYDKNFIKLAKQVSEDIGIQRYVKEGVYAIVGGPTYESVAETKYLRLAGVDAVGMSTVTEVIVACQVGIKVFGFSLITNKAIEEYELEEEPNHTEVLAVANERQKDLQNFVSAFVKKITEI